MTPRPGTPYVLWTVLLGSAVVAVSLATQAVAIDDGQPTAAAAVTATGSPLLVPTAHPPVPASLRDAWLAPSLDEAPRRAPHVDAFVRGVALLEEDDDAGRALPLVSAPALRQTPVADYARYYTGRALLRLERYVEADAAFADVVAAAPPGFLKEEAALRQGEAREARKDWAAARAVYAALTRERLASPQVAWLRLGRAAREAGNHAEAVQAFRHVYDEYPLSSEAADAEEALDALDAFAYDTPAAVAKELARAERLFGARRWSAARSAFARLREHAEGATWKLAGLRLAEIEQLTGRHRHAVERLRPYLDEAGFEDEAGYYYARALRGVGNRDDFERRARQLADRHRTSPWAEAMLDQLGTHYIVIDEDAKAAAVFREILERFPAGPHAERAAWKAGWWAYRHDQYRDAIRYFEHGAQHFPRSDYRPEWLYWSARAYEAAGDIDDARARYQLVVTDYRNLYHGQLAVERLSALTSRGAGRVPAATNGAAPPPSPAPAAAGAPPTTDRIQLLLGLGLYRAALDELQYAERMWGTSTPLRATMALAYNRLGSLRTGINVMKRAYPQFMTDEGDRLPAEVLEVIYPLDYWPLIQKHARARGLDPFLVAALVAQESTFDPAIRSSANAIGLMQILPSTGSRYARKLGIRPFNRARLTNPEVNVRIGTTYFAELVKEFGGAHFALASYNAGESRVRRWRAERPGVPQDEFIDDIPFPETQNYVKRILGTADHYRRLYGAAE